MVAGKSMVGRYALTRRDFLRDAWSKSTSGLVLGGGLGLLGGPDSAAESSAGIPLPRPKHIVVILADTLRWDYTSAYSAERCQTPNIDRLTDGGTLFQHAFTVAPSSAPSYASLWSGLFPFQHGVTCNAMDLPPEVPYLPEAIHDAGYHTAGFVSNCYCGSKHGYNRGWDEFFEQDRIGRFAWTFARELLPWLYRRDLRDESTFLFVAYMDPHVPYSPPHMPRWLRITLNKEVIGEARCPELDDMQAVAVELAPGENRLTLERVVGPLRTEWKPKYRVIPQGWRGLMAQGVTLDPEAGDLRYIEPGGAGVPYWLTDHFPCTLRVKNPSTSSLRGMLYFRVSRDYGVDEARVLYPQCVEVMDYEIGNVLDAYQEQGVFDETLFVFLSDHGEGLGDHGLVGHLEQVYDSLLRVPLIVRYPPLTTIPRAPQMASLIDVAPTLCEVLGLEMPTGFGRSLAPCMMRQGVETRPWVLGETYPPEAHNRLSTFRTAKHSLIINKTKRELEYYNLDADPGQMKNARDTAPDQVDSLVAAYGRLLGITDPFSESESDAEGLYESLTTEQLEGLQAAGYL